MEVSSADLWKIRQGDKTSYIYHTVVTRRLWLQETRARMAKWQLTARIQQRHLEEGTAYMGSRTTLPWK